MEGRRLFFESANLIHALPLRSPHDILCSIDAFLRKKELRRHEIVATLDQPINVLFPNTSYVGYGRVSLLFYVLHHLTYVQYVTSPLARRVCVELLDMAPRPLAPSVSALLWFRAATSNRQVEWATALVRHRVAMPSFWDMHHELLSLDVSMQTSGGSRCVRLDQEMWQSVQRARREIGTQFEHRDVFLALKGPARIKGVRQRRLLPGGDSGGGGGGGGKWCYGDGGGGYFDLYIPLDVWRHIFEFVIPTEGCSSSSS